MTGCDAEPGIIADAFRLMLVTSQRRGEVLSMRWQDVETRGNQDEPEVDGASEAARVLG